MVDAYTFDDGAGMRKFRTRAEMYDYMVENGHHIDEGDDVPKFSAHVEKRLAKNANDSKAAAVKAKMEK